MHGYQESAAGNDAAIRKEDFQELREIVYSRSGIFLADTLKNLLVRRLSGRLEALGLKSFGEYTRHLRESSVRAGEFSHLFDAVTISESSFFRNAYQLECLKNVILPEKFAHAESSGNPTLRILSAGCAAGEEPYSLALLIRRHFPGIEQRMRIEITGTDISEQALENARRAEYPEYLLGKGAQDYLPEYFTMSGSRFALSPQIRELVQFRKCNLIEGDEMRPLGRFDLVFCCNVLIYFDKPAKSRVMNTIYDLLNPGGYFFIGQSESLHGIPNQLKLHIFNKAIAYRKE